MKCFKSLASLTMILSSVCFAPSSLASLNFDKLGGTMVAFGKIAEGDYQRFVEEYLTWEAPPTVFSFDSVGGNVIEAIAIANFIRSSRIPILITGKCFSACALIYLAASSRQATGEIGVHRPYYDQSFFAGLTSYEAEAKYKELEAFVARFLTDIGVDKRLVEIMKSVPSDKMRIYIGQDETSRFLGDKSSFMEEWQIAKCGSVDDTARVGYCAYTWLEYIYLNTKLVDGWEEEFLSNLTGKYRQDMPAMCQGSMDEILVVSADALQDSELFEVLRLYSEDVKLRGQCISRAQDTEVRSFFRSLKSSKQVAEYFRRPALTIVLEKYGH